MRLGHFFGSHTGQVASPLVGLQKNFVGKDVEFLLRLALNVFAAGFTEYASVFSRCTLADGD